MSKAVEIINAVMAPANKLIDAVTGAIGKAYEPRHVRKMAQAKAYEINAIGEALRDNADIEIQYDKQAITANTSDFEEFVKRTQSRLAFQELQKQQNIENVTDKAYDLLAEETECSEEPVDKDWMIRFFNSVEDISDEDMQQLWAQLLAGEIKRPKSFSLRTLEALKNLSKYEAETFQALNKFVIVGINNCYIPGDIDIRDEFGIEFADLLNSSECGLISIIDTIEAFYEIAPNSERAVFGNENIDVIVKNNQSKKILTKASAFPLTTIGGEISTLFDAEISDENLLVFARYFQSVNPTVSVEALSLIQISEPTRPRLI